MKDLYVEIVKERILSGPRGIVASEFRKALPEDVIAAQLAHKRNDDPHANENTTVFYDKGGWMYDFRHCAICDQVIAFI